MPKKHQADDPANQTGNDIDFERQAQQLSDLPKINNPNFKFVIVGGGTAGWLTALYMGCIFPRASVTVIESADIGILGAGEGTTSHFQEILQTLDVDFSAFVKRAHATCKNGIKFTNWNGDGSSFVHPFSDPPELNYEHFYHDSRIPNSLTANSSRGYNALVMDQLRQGKNLDSVSYTTKVSCDNRIKFKPLTDTGTKLGPSFRHFQQVGTHAWHFDARQLAEFLRETGTYQRGIRLVTGTVVSVVSKENGDIRSLVLDNQDPVDCDFVFDCTGFQRLLIGRHFKSNWISWQKHLPAKRALPFILPETAELPPYTESIAMKHGWVWRIPVQGRYGCGYVFDSDRVSDDQAHDELVNWFGTDIVSPRTFKFEPGIYEKIWIRNCMAIGLSAGFIEPLEATSIGVSVQSLWWFINHLTGLLHDDDKSRQIVSRKVQHTMTTVMEFIYFHYMTRRNDSDFWTRFTYHNLMPDRLKERVESLQHLELGEEPTPTPAFGNPSYLVIGAGNKFFDSRRAEMKFQSLTLGEDLQLYHLARGDFERNLELNSHLAIDHRWFLNYVMTGNV